MPLSPAAARPLGLALGVVADALLADPRRYHPVAGFGRAAQALERRLHADAVAPGAVFTTVAVGVPWLLGVAAERVTARRPLARVAVTAVATWAVLGGTSLAREGQVMAGLLDAAQSDAAGAATSDAARAGIGAEETPALQQARARLSHLCARDPSQMSVGDLARATVESLAENTSDAAVAPLLWGAVAGVPGLLAYRAANTLDAMVGYTSPRYLRFGRVSARFDDLVNLVPARVTGLLTVAAAPVVGGSVASGWRVLRADGARHPSPNAGRPEAATAGVLGVVLGGENVYAGRVERRPGMGVGGRAPRAADVRRAVRLGRVVVAEGALVAVGLAAVLARRASRGGRAARS
ncbi:MAG: cobalamin biosynthesis protein [Actinobacteria bacterium]|nr:cobalamin biosynthesis protein [Actinomycetota bacterium]